MYMHAHIYMYVCVYHRYSPIDNDTQPNLQLRNAIDTGVLLNLSRSLLLL